MRVSCEACGARYRIERGLADGRHLKLRCRGCGGTISVGEATLASPPEDESSSPPPPPGAGRVGPPPPPSPPTWFAVVGGDLNGPFFSNELRRRIAHGLLGADALLWRAGMQQWVPLVRVEEVGRWFDLAEQPPPVPTLPDQLPPRGFTAPLPAAWPIEAPWPAEQVAQPAPATLAAPPPALGYGGSGPQMPGAQMPGPHIPGPQLPPPLPRGAKRARWPVWLAIAGTLVMALVVGLALWLGRVPDEPAARPATTARAKARRRAPIAIHIGQAQIRIARDNLPDAGFVIERPAPRWRITRLPPVEVNSRAAESERDAGQDAAARLSGDQSNVLAERVLRRNESALIACAKLAERRGVETKGTDAMINIQVGKDGRAEVEVTGEGLDRRLRSCYRAVLRGISFPAQPRPYRLRVRRLH